MLQSAGFVFQMIARRITVMEFPRTQSEFEKSYTFKMFLFQFINNYSSLIYTAFFKGRFYIDPGDENARSSYISRLISFLKDLKYVQNNSHH